MALFFSHAYNSLMPFSDPSSLRKPKASPPDSTHEEAAYLKSLVEKQKPVAIRLTDGETVRGWIEYYDVNMLRLTREGKPNLFIFKHQIAYVAEEGGK
jgi:host factor-I protein